MTPDEAKAKGHKVEFTGPTVQISGLPEMIKSELDKMAFDYGRMARAIEALAKRDRSPAQITVDVPALDISGLVQAIASISPQITVDVPAPNITFPEPTVAAVAAEARPLVQSAEVEHKIVQGMPVLTKIHFKY